MLNPFNRAGVCLLWVVIWFAPAAAQDTFTGNEGFPPVLKGLGATPAPLMDKSIQIPGNVELNGSIRWSTPSGSVCFTSDDSVLQIYVDIDCDRTYEPGSGEFYIGSGGAGTDDIWDVFQRGNIIDSANVTTPLRLQNGGDDFLDVYINASGDSIIEATKDGADTGVTIDLKTGQCFGIEGDGTPLWEWCADGTDTLANDGRTTGYLQWTSAGMIGDNANCNRNPTEEFLGAVPGDGIRCPMTGTDTDGTVTSDAVRLPDNFDKSAGITAELMAWVHTDEGACTWHGRITIDCSHDSQFTAYSPLFSGLDLTPEGGGKVVDSTQSTINTDGTGGAEDCDPGDYISWEWTSCDTDPTPSGGCTSSAGCEDNMSLQSMTLFYTKKAR